MLTNFQGYKTNKKGFEEFIKGYFEVKNSVKQRETYLGGLSKCMSEQVQNYKEHKGLLEGKKKDR